MNGQLDCKTKSGMYYLEDKRLRPFEAVDYLVECGFSRGEAVDYLNSLEYL